VISVIAILVVTAAVVLIVTTPTKSGSRTPSLQTGSSSSGSTSSTSSQLVSATSNTTSSVGPSTLNQGPLSAFPAVWARVCGFPAQGTETTFNDVMLDPTAPGNNVSLSQVYSRIVNSTPFQEQTAGYGWATYSWDSMDMGNNNGSLQWYILGQFVRLSGGEPSGFIQAFYDLATGAVTTDYEGTLAPNCPGGGGGYSTGGSLDGPSPGYFPVGQPIGINFSVSDYGIQNFTFTSPTSCLGSFTILQGDSTGPEVYNSAEHTSCSGGPLSLALNPGQSYNQTVSWKQTNDAGQQVPEGVYELMGVIAGSGTNTSMPWGQIHVGITQSTLALNASVFETKFSYGGFVVNSYVAPGKPVEITWGLNDNAGVHYQLETSRCSYTYKILNFSNAVVFDSAKALGCNPNQLLDNPVPEYDGVAMDSYWSQTDDSGRQVPSGVYRAIIDLHVVNEGHVFNETAESDFEISPSGGPPSRDQISVGTSFMCLSTCLGPTPGLYSVVDTNGNYTSLRLYLNGTLIGTVSNPPPCCRLTYEYVFNVPLDNETTHIVPGVSYDLVVVGTFKDGNTTTSWTNVRGG